LGGRLDVRVGLSKTLSRSETDSTFGKRPKREWFGVVFWQEKMTSWTLWFLIAWCVGQSRRLGLWDRLDVWGCVWGCVRVMNIASCM